MNKSRILFVCLGNICRSPLAEGIMLHYTHQYNLPLDIDSAAIESYHIGETPDYRAIKIAQKHGIDISNLTARQFQLQDFQNFDRIFIMDNFHYKYLYKITPDKNLFRSKVDYLMNLLYPHSNIEVPDPYYGTEKDFEHVFKMIDSACLKLVEMHKQQ